MKDDELMIRQEIEYDEARNASAAAPSRAASGIKKRRDRTSTLYTRNRL